MGLHPFAYTCAVWDLHPFALVPSPHHTRSNVCVSLAMRVSYHHTRSNVCVSLAIAYCITTRAAASAYLWQYAYRCAYALLTRHSVCCYQVLGSDLRHGPLDCGWTPLVSYALATRCPSTAECCLALSDAMLLPGCPCGDPVQVRLLLVLPAAPIR
eukprot:654062-Rhodomonas_salina.3